MEFPAVLGAFLTLGSLADTLMGALLRAFVGTFMGALVGPFVVSRALYFSDQWRRQAEIADFCPWSSKRTLQALTPPPSPRCPPPPRLPGWALPHLHCQ